MQEIIFVLGAYLRLKLYDLSDSSILSDLGALRDRSTKELHHRAVPWHKRRGI